MVAFAVMLSSNCLTGAEMTEAQMACCVTMGSECGHHAQDMTCCSIESQRVEQSPAVKSITIPQPVAVANELATFAEVPQWLVHRGHHFDGFTPKPPGVPTYLLVSTLLI